MTEQEFGRKVKAIIACCIAWNFPLMFPGSRKLSWDESERALLDLIREADYVKPEESKRCYYCHLKPDGAMLVMGDSIAHADCVIRKLNELLDPDWETGREPNKIIRFLEGKPVGQREWIPRDGHLPSDEPDPDWIQQAKLNQTCEPDPLDVAEEG